MNLIKPIHSLKKKKQKKKTGPKPETKNLPELRSVFLGIFKVKEYLIITPLII